MGYGKRFAKGTALRYPIMQHQDTRSIAALLLAWLVPGMGHCYLGWRQRGVLIFLLLVPLYLFGLYLGSRSAINPERILACRDNPDARPPISIISPRNHPVYFLIQSLAGLPTLAAAALNRGAVTDSPTIITDLGLLITCVVGALNLILMVDAFCAMPFNEQRTNP